MARIKRDSLARRIAYLSAEKPELSSSQPEKPMLRSTMSTGNEIPFRWDSSSQRWKAENWKAHNPGHPSQLGRNWIKENAR